MVVREKQGLGKVRYNHTGDVVQASVKLTEKAPLKVQYNQDGTVLAYSTSKEVFVMRVDEEGAERLLCQVPVEAMDFSLSPSGRHLTTFCSPAGSNLTTGEAASTEPNMHIWRIDLESGQLRQLGGFLHRHQNSWEVQWTADENFFARIVGSEVRFYRSEDPSKVAFKVQEDNLTAFSLSPDAYPKVAVFVKEAKGEPASIKIFLLPSVQKPIAKKYFYKADKIQFQWSPTGKHLLALTHTDVDSTGQSYYGENNLYFMSGDGSFDCRVSLDKSGPVHDVAWGTRGDEFIACYGYMPSKMTLFNLKCEAAFEFPVESKNHVRYSPAGNLVLFGGFGNLAGYVEVWTRSGTTLRRVGHLQSPSSSICEWAPSGHAIITATVTPRLRVDNGFKIWSWQGRLLEHRTFPELYQVTWRPNPVPKAYPLVDFSKAALQQTALPAEAEAAPKKQAYVPPALRNRQTSAPPSKAAPAKPAVAVQLATISSGLSNREKNIRKLQKKLEQIRELKAKLADGAQLELNQLDKISMEYEVVRELDAAIASPDNA